MREGRTKPREGAVKIREGAAGIRGFWTADSGGLPVALPVDPLVRHAEALHVFEVGLQEAWRRLLAFLFGGLALEFADAGAAGEDLDGGGVGDEFADQLSAAPAAAPLSARFAG